MSQRSTTGRAYLVLLALPALAAAAAAPPRVLAEGQQSAVQKPRQSVARSQKEWEKQWLEQFAGPFGGERPPPPRVDFRKEMALGAFLGRRPTAGYRVRITGARAENGKLVVSVEEGKPPRGAITAQVLTAPFQFVAVGKSALPVVWEHTGADAARRARQTPGWERLRAPETAEREKAGDRILTPA